MSEQEGIPSTGYPPQIGASLCTQSNEMKGTTMNLGRLSLSFLIVIITMLIGMTSMTFAQVPGGPRITSPEVGDDRKVTFRILAPDAEKVVLGRSGDIPGMSFREETPLKKSNEGVWEITLGPLDPGAYRYNFNVDGISTLDPRNAKTSESNSTTWSLVNVSGFETHGFDVIYKETDGGHTWDKWRDYLYEFAPQLFQ